MTDSPSLHSNTIHKNKIPPYNELRNALSDNWYQTIQYKIQCKEKTKQKKNKKKKKQQQQQQKKKN